MQKALVLGHDSRAFLGVIRSLGRGGVRVHVAWHRPDSVALRSRYIAKAHRLPAFHPQRGEWRQALAGLIRREAFDLVIPCTDAAVAALQEHRLELGRYGRLYVLDDLAYRILFDKARTTRWARRVGVPTPREVVIRRAERAGPALEGFAFPVVLKPRSSYRPEDPGLPRVVRKAYGQEQLQRELETMLELGPVVVQENFIGQGVGVELLMDRGKPVMQFQHVRVHEPLYGGGSSYRTSVPVCGELLDAALRILRPLAYTGVAMVEFRRNPRTGAWVFLEVNARFWGSLPLALASGADFPLGLFQLLVEGRVRVSRRYRTGIWCRNLRLDLGWQRANLLADRSDPTLAVRPLGAVVGEACMNVLLLRERSDTFTLDDPGPGVAEVGQLLRSVGGRLGRMAAERYLRPGFVRRRLTRRAAEALGQAQRVLFVCKGNICRSPFAEQLLRKEGAFQEVCSAGCLPRPGRRPPAEAVAAAAQWGVDCSSHRSRGLTEAMVRGADAILVFDYENYQQVCSAHRFARRRIHFVGALCPAGPLFIADPWGADLEQYHRVYAQIARALECIDPMRSRRSLASAVRSLES